MVSVFISSSSQDIELARDLARRLRKAGLEPVTAFPEDFSAGTPWKKSLHKKIRGADAVLFLVTPAALKSAWMMTELGMAEGMGRVILPVSAGVKRSDLPLPMQDYEFAPFDQVDDAIESLSEKLSAGAKD